MTDYRAYDRDVDDDALVALTTDLGRQHLDGEDAPSTDDMIREYEDTHRVAMPDQDGPDLDRVRRLARKGWRAGRRDVVE